MERGWRQSRTASMHVERHLDTKAGIRDVTVMITWTHKVAGTTVAKCGPGVTDCSGICHRRGFQYFSKCLCKDVCSTSVTSTTRGPTDNTESSASVIRGFRCVWGNLTGWFANSTLSAGKAALPLHLSSATRMSPP
ncbi:unnamed protein product [Pleuronectes platessa]|uniref:Uncharacterized protein n=1 Tax=Pleuronectes platessa TaxID=8262 RepID=A0A9N7VR30_PLEPL|nr:unnamed protein product [Pleuronectes platessa]